jgi:hypothetical protein
MRVGISPHAIDHISLIKIAGNQNIIGIAVISFAGSTRQKEQSSLTAACYKNVIRRAGFRWG